ncbi:hypothetical protein L596_023760 [Steinernema carpocapsae]|uniref:Strawberry notch AAA domain-containing protein n=1 Tax=Steinernema carpocapsae TaxID=34508 RepID=A0A4U5MEL7_STECR|nr:hypothetical protein L596_023760 [Steinernema carpocapsae]
MDDILSVVILEAGLTEYLSEPNSPAPPLATNEAPRLQLAPAATSEAQAQDISQQQQIMVEANSNGNYAFQQPADVRYMETGSMDFGFSDSMTSSSSAPVIDDPTNDLNYFFSDLPASFMNPSTSEQQQPSYVDPIPPIDTSSTMNAVSMDQGGYAEASPSTHYVAPTFDLDSPSSSAFSSPSENSDPLTLTQSMRIQDTPSPIIRAPSSTQPPMRIGSHQPSTATKKAKLVTTAKGERYLVDKDGRKIDVFKKIVRANGEVVSTGTGQIQSSATNGSSGESPAPLRAAEVQPRIVSAGVGANQKIYMVRETEDGQQQATAARVVRLPDGRLVARTVNRPGSPVVVSVNGGQSGLLVRRRLSTPNLVNMDNQSQTRKVSMGNVRNLANPPYVAIDGEHMIVTPPESSSNSPVPVNEPKYVPVSTNGQRQQFVRTTASGGRQVVVRSTPNTPASAVKVVTYRQPDGTLVQQRQIVARSGQPSPAQRIPGQYSGRYDAERIRSGGAPIRRPPMNAGENHEQMMEAAAAAATAPLSPQLPTSRMLQMNHLNSADQRFVRVRPDQLDQRQGNRPPPLPMPGTIKRTVSMASVPNVTRVIEPPASAPPFDPIKAAKKKAAGDEMRAALQAGAELNDRNHEFDTEEENLGHAETYAEYVPSKLRSGMSHPDCVVETASLSSVQPPDVRYQIQFPEELIDSGCISALQLEAVIYACQMHQNHLPSGERCGYLIGDGAGVGKGRTIACIIYENYLLGRKRAIWLSVSSDLRYDSERDFRDIGAGSVNVYQLNKLKYAKISGKENGGIKKGVMFATYSSLIGECRTAKSKYRSRLKQLVQWCGPDFDGVIVFDECHRAKNLCPTAGSKPTKTGRMVLELQKELPNARVVYASATGASEPRNMAYMTRLGLWGPGQSFPSSRTSSTLWNVEASERWKSLPWT